MFLVFFQGFSLSNEHENELKKSFHMEKLSNGKRRQIESLDFWRGK
ncbi:hypothetical protein CFter6_2460 [Collimonas fungivorans]|uniref:Uncharacterized protein n=1 Tax=Collimonas fungivorans TaxID=158899 RepID=A0A127PBC9_9BURK|nr:hypothetical protein CFter6_2460 [Collimonas fungivorans]